MVLVCGARLVGAGGGGGESVKLNLSFGSLFVFNFGRAAFGQNFDVNIVMCDDCKQSKIRVYLKIQFLRRDREQAAAIIDIALLMLFSEAGFVNCENDTKHINAYIGKI